jgi:hypothetical protein
MDQTLKIANKGFILQQCEAFLDENNIGHSRYEEDGECVGIEMEQWTNIGVDMIHLIDGRDRDMNDPDWWKDELESIYEAFDVDEYIDINRQDEKYRRAFTYRQSVEDFEDYDKWLKGIAEQAKAYNY